MSLELHRKSFELVSMTYLKEKSTARQQNMFRAPKIAKRRFPKTDVE